MKLSIQSSNPKLCENEVQEFAKKYEITDEDYKKFLLEFNGGEPSLNAFLITGMRDNPEGVIQSFFGLRAHLSTEDIELVLKEHRGLVPDKVIPVACNDFYDFVCLDARHTPAIVVFWDRRNFWGSDRWDDADLYFIAPNFEEFLGSLHGYVAPAEE